MGILSNNTGIDIKYIYICILVIAVTVYLLKMLPIVVFKKKIENKFLNKFLSYVPFGVMTSLVFPEVFFSTVPKGTANISVYVISATVGILVAVILGFRGKKLPIIILSTVFITFALQQILAFTHVFG